MMMRLAVQTLLILGILEAVAADPRVSTRSSLRPKGCLTTPDPGECRGAFPRYFYNADLDQCDCFLYGGCDNEDVIQSSSWLTLDLCNSICNPGNREESNRCKLLPQLGIFNFPQPTVCDPSCVNGACISSNYCSCQSGWTGNQCQTPVCDPSCINGECISPNTCSCQSGWTGPQCQTFSSSACETYPAGVQGICVPMQDCPRFKGLMRMAKEGRGDALDTLRRSVCSLDPPTLCCEPAEQHPNEPVLPPDCGSGKISDFKVGGEDASWYPWMVLFGGRYTQGPHRGISTFFCGGSLISDRFVLTAAHCITSEIDMEIARVGELITSTNPDIYKGRAAPPVQDIPVGDLIIHPQYRKPCSTCNDIAIVKLRHPVKMHQGFVNSICLPLDPKRSMGFSASQFQGKIAKAAGWGTSNLYDPDPEWCSFIDQIEDCRDLESHCPHKCTGPSRPGQSEHLQEVDLTIETRQHCQQHTRSQHPTDSVICAGFRNGNDTCKGDSGGPLMLTNEIGTRYFLIGITSFGPISCGGPGTRGVYTSVHYYLQWIQEIIRS